jgi:hypothetical protein
VKLFRKKAIIAAALLIWLVTAFLWIDRTSHSASDTLRPFAGVVLLTAAAVVLLLRKQGPPRR